MMVHISVIIATCKRNNLLLERSLKSVYSQTYDKNVDVIVCVDASDSVIVSEVTSLQQQINMLRDVESVETFPTKVIANRRTKFHSGTGAWNTAILSVIDFVDQNKNDSHYIAILDDDDSWDNEYLENVVKKCSLNTGMVISGIRYINSEGRIKSIIATELNKEEIFIKNPGIFGSNIFINLNAFLCAGGFDESMKSTTDRDFLMRYTELSKYSNYKTVFCNFIFVNHYADENRNRVTNNQDLKKQGLNIFYYKWQKYIQSEELYNQSAVRAKELFGYNKLEFNFLEDDKLINIKPCKTVSNKINIVIGFICFELINFKRLIKSISNIKYSPYLNNLFIYVLSNKDYELQFKEEIKLSDLNIILDCNRDSMDSIAINRTVLRKGIYKYFTNKDFITWIVDDDLELYKKDYFKKIAYYKEQNEADLLFSVTTGEPPIPFLLTLRRNLIQYFFLKDNKYNDYKIVNQKMLSDFYYDLTEDFKYLELPIGFINKDEDIVLNRIKKGQSSYTIDFFKSYFGYEIPGNRYNIVGGNCIILNKEFLLIPNFTPDEKKYNRRSDFNWSILCQKKNARIKRVYLPLKHVRETIFNLEKEIRKLENDLEGNRFYRIFYDIVINNKSFEDVTIEYNQMLVDIKQKLYFNMMRIKYLISRIPDSEIKRIGDLYEKAIRKILKTKFSFSKDIYLKSINSFKNI